MKRETDVTAVWTKVRTCSRVGSMCSRCGFDQRFRHYVHQGKPHCARCFLSMVGAADVDPKNLDGFFYAKGKLVLVIHEPANLDDWPIGEVRYWNGIPVRRRQEPLYDAEPLGGAALKKIETFQGFTPFKGFAPGFDPTCDPTCRTPPRDKES